MEIGERLMSASRIETLPAMDRASVNHLDIFTVPVFGNAKDAKEISFAVNGRALGAGIKEPRQQDGAQSQSKTEWAIYKKITDHRRNPRHESHAQLTGLQAEPGPDQHC